MSWRCPYCYGRDGDLTGGCSCGYLDEAGRPNRGVVTLVGTSWNLKIRRPEPGLSAERAAREREAKR